MIVHSREVGSLDPNKHATLKATTEQRRKSWKRQNAEEVLSLEQEYWFQFWILLAKKTKKQKIWGKGHLMGSDEVPLFLLSKLSSSIYFAQRPLGEVIRKRGSVEIMWHFQHVGKGYALSNFKQVTSWFCARKSLLKGFGLYYVISS